jgi:uncharacterized membrane-anchored protein
MRILPLINGKYWIALSAASVFGTNTGDYLSEQLNMGNTAGLPYLAAILAILFALERFGPWASALYFWAIIIVVRTAATNIADATHEMGIYGIGAALALLALFIGMVRRYKARIVAQPDSTGAPRVDALYWVVMALAGIVGTLLGDFSSLGFGYALYAVGHVLGWTTESFSFDWVTPGHVLAAMLSGGLTVLKFRRTALATLAKPYPYWTLVALIRTTGTAVGDYIAKTPLEITGALVVDGAVFVLAVGVFYAYQKGNQLAVMPASLPAR